MNAIEFIELAHKLADQYSKDAQASISRNKHMNELSGFNPSQPVIDAVLVDFINYAAERQGIDYALYTSDLRK